MTLSLWHLALDRKFTAGLSKLFSLKTDQLCLETTLIKVVRLNQAQVEGYETKDTKTMLKCSIELRGTTNTVISSVGNGNILIGAALGFRSLVEYSGYCEKYLTDVLLLY